MRTREELAWAAGFYVGEGSISAFRQKGRATSRNLVIAMNQNELEPLVRFQEAIGFGKIYGPYKRTAFQMSEFYAFRLGRFELIQALIAMLWPWLSPRRQAQARTALVDFLAGNHRPGPIRREASH